MRVTLALASLVIIFLGTSRVGAQPDLQNDPLHLGVDLSAGSEILDLAETPPALDLLRQLGFDLRDRLLDTQFQKEMRDILPTLAAKIPAAGGGFLLEVSTYVAETGEVRIPGGQLLGTIGPGMEPVDALAEEMLHGEVRNAPPGSPYRDERSYVWLTMRDGHLAGALIPKELAVKLRDSARAERKRRDRLGAWEASSAGDLDSAQRANFWQSMATAHAQKVANDADRKQIDALTSQMNSAVQSFNTAYNEELRLQREIEARDARLAVLDKIEAITSLLNTAAKAQSLVCADGKPVSAAGPPSVDASAMGTLQQAARNALKSAADAVKSERNQVQILDLKLELLYRNNGVTVPSRQPIAVP